MAATSHGIQVVDRERVEAPTPAAPERRDAVGDADAVAPAALPAAGIGTVGILTLLVGAWGGIVPFVGPLFGYSGDGSVAWYWSLPHALLWLAPGAGAVLAGILMLGAVPRALAGLGRIGVFGAGLLAAVCGAWFVIGPEAWPVLQRSAGVFAPAGPLRELARMVGYSFGPGVLLAALGGLAMGMAGHRARAVRRAPGAASARSATPSQPVTA